MNHRRLLPHEAQWREQALAEYERNGGRAVVLPVETPNEDCSFSQMTDPNWFYAVGSARSNVTGVVTVVPGAGGQPKVGLDYQVNVWDRFDIPDGEPGRQHKVGLAQEFNMAGSGSVKHYELGNGAALPARDGGGEIDR
ncbi:hypothetical protein ABTX82_00735 [Streptomyces lavendulae]|uniref:hypothetical protein n=1 Tax=Streptomyces lavendulae TaxID=1914 RepID=UPI00331BD1C2